MFISFRNLGTVNKNLVILGDLAIWFSYETPVAYQITGSPKVVRANDWSRTTGKLLNELEPNKHNRISGQLFEEQLAALVAKFNA